MAEIAPPEPRSLADELGSILQLSGQMTAQQQQAFINTYKQTLGIGAKTWSKWMAPGGGLDVTLAGQDRERLMAIQFMREHGAEAQQALLASNPALARSLGYVDAMATGAFQNIPEISSTAQPAGPRCPQARGQAEPGGGAHGAAERAGGLRGPRASDGGLGLARRGAQPRHPQPPAARAGPDVCRLARGECGAIRAPGRPARQRDQLCPGHLRDADDRGGALAIDQQLPGAAPRGRPRISRRPGRPRSATPATSSIRT